MAALIVILTGCGRVAFDQTSDASSSDGGTADAAPLASRGYFVEVSDVPSAALGGLVAADTYCVNELTTKSWLDKAAAMQAGQLTSSKIRAWLCSTVGCRNLVPGTTYAYASTQTSSGGGTFVATAEGFLEDDGRPYDATDVFGDHGALVEYLTGRGQDNLPQADTCGDWTTTVGQTLVAVSDTPFYPERLAKYPRNCTFNASIICIVDR